MGLKLPSAGRGPATPFIPKPMGMLGKMVGMKGIDRRKKLKENEGKA